ncbi:MAG: hypothetical protein KF802_13475 [Bdellovibrionaceae bacterium]|nr:hypothetical protein [Pseudobdellovibrionaceae bacterium]MBX3034450.1 hypothetical protein [Pseudobdellovibrionaceae bacterium]
MSYEFYKILHITGVIMTFIGLAGVLAVKMTAPELPARPRRLFFLTHGLGLLIALVAGFGLAARLQMFQNLPGWVWAKIGIWIILGGAVAVAKRRGQLGGPLLTVFIAFGACAAWLAITKPF